MNKRETFVATALTWDGVPWKKVGSRRSGVNCLGFLVGVARECNFDMDIAVKEAEANFTSSPEPGYMLRRAKEDLDIILLEDAVPGDLLMFRLGHEPSHIAIITNLNPLMFIHSWQRAGKVTLTPMPVGWHPAAVFRIRDLD